MFTFCDKNKEAVEKSILAQEPKAIVRITELHMCHVQRIFENLTGLKFKNEPRMGSKRKKSLSPKDFVIALSWRKEGLESERACVCE